MRRPEVCTWVIFLVAGAAVSALVAQPAPARAAGSGAAILTPERAAALAFNTLEAVDGGFSLHNPRHRASFTAGGVTVTPRSGSPSWSWRLARVGPASSQVSQIGAAPVVPTQPEVGVVRYAREILDEEYELRAGAIEQRFILHRPPPLDGGDLVLEGVVRCSGEFRTADQGCEWRDERGLLRVAPPAVVDRDGVILPSSLELSAGATRLTVDGAALAAATYPVTIGLELRSHELRISDVGDTGDPDYDAFTPAVAYNSTDNQYLVVWSGDDNIGGLVNGEDEIFGQRLDAATGAELGANDFRISDMGSTGGPAHDAADPAVAYNDTDNQYLVVWSGDDNVGGLLDEESEIFGQRLDAATGVAVGDNDFRISEMGGTGDPNYDGYYPAVAFNGTDNQYLVVWTGDKNVSGLVDEELEIFGQRLDAATGAEVGTNDFRISGMGGTGVPAYGAYDPRVSFNPANHEYLVVWYGDDNVGGLIDNEFEIFGQRLDSATGTAVGADDFRISDTGGTGDFRYSAARPAIAYNGADNEYLVVWMGSDDVGGLVENEFEVFGQRLDAATGAEAGPNDFRISEMGGTGYPAYDADFPAVAYDSASSQYLVVWRGDDYNGGMVDEELEIFGQRLDAATGAEAGPNDFRISEMGGSGNPIYGANYPAVASSAGAGQYLVVWCGDDNVGGLVNEEYEIFGRRLGILPFADGFESGDTSGWSTTVP